MTLRVGIYRLVGILIVGVGLCQASIINGSFEAGLTGYTQDAFFSFNAPAPGAPNYLTFLASQTDPTRTTVIDSNTTVTSQTSTFDGAGTVSPPVLPTNGDFLLFLSNETSSGDGSMTGSSISQTFVIPMGINVFSFDIAFLNDDANPSADFDDFGGVALLFGGSVVNEYNIDLSGLGNASVQGGIAAGGFRNSAPFRSVTFDVSALQGSTVTVVSYVTQVGDNTVESRLLLDNLALSTSVTPAPEPGSLILMLGAAVIGCLFRLRKTIGSSILGLRWLC